MIRHMKHICIYISGPISGIKREEYMWRFREVQTILEGEGLRVCNPTRLAPCRFPWLYKLLGYRWTLAYDMWHLSHCTHIIMLDGWEWSRGARLERMKAHEWDIKEVKIYTLFE